MKNILALFILVSSFVGFGQDSLKTHIESNQLDSLPPKMEFPVIYDFGKATVNESSDSIIEEMAELLFDNPTTIVEIGNHMDSRGSDHYSSNLTQKRAESVMNELIKLGISKDRIVAKGYGDSKPTTYNGIVLTEAYINQFYENDKPTYEMLHQKNRRTEIVVLSYEYVPNTSKKTHATPFLLNE
ncbi:OmpA family protein [Paracrocinitomix mangrovi]|uniref:OmpA family protein n=1 Tax=Paracrocinitomix mangrovi TaxID=2862509 RepID=UPI001C8D9CBF|nr:OmpA family protein [Paracrocinitomix mangrovi]UKN00174.1 OmpA family protein [Paracrocinitomix mangrovi]